MKKIISLMLLLAIVLSTFVLYSCTGMGDLKIGVLREDDTSGEAKAWDKYLNKMSKEMGFEVDYIKTASSADEVSAINTYASKGFNVIFLLSDDDIVSAVNTAAKNEMYVVCPTGNVTDAQYEEIKDNPFFLGTVSPSFDIEYKAGYDMAKYFVEEKGEKTFTIFGGATLFGSMMHAERLAGMLAYLCEDPDTNYDGVKTRENLLAKLVGKSLDPSKFKSNKYKITGYMDNFLFDDAFTTKLTNSLEAGGTCILSVGAGDTVTKIAYGIKGSNSKITSLTTGGVDAITEDYAQYFDLGYSYDCGKYASAMAPALVLSISAINGVKITTSEGYAVRLPLNYWIATSKEELNEMLSGDNDKNGYCYNEKVIEHFVGTTYEEFMRLCTADYTEARKIHDEYNKEVVSE